VRELQNELQRYLAEQRLEFIGDLQNDTGTDTGMMQIESNLSQLGLRKTLDEIEKRLIARKLMQNQGHTGKTAEMLDIPLRTLQRKIQKYGL
jgi:DNA-binding NtrC family response regulator